MRVAVGFFVLLLGLSFASEAVAQQQVQEVQALYSVEIPEMPLRDALKAFEEQTGLSLVYSPSRLPSDQIAHLSVYQVTQEVLLDRFFRPLGIAYSLIGGQIVLRIGLPPQSLAVTQTVRGQVVDKDTQAPLVGVNVIVDSVPLTRGTVTNEAGIFSFGDLPVGRHDIAFTYLGFAPVRTRDLLLTAGKEVVLSVEMIETPIALGQVTVRAAPLPAAPLNDAGVVSARGFSVEHTERFAASVSDPARMVQSLPGVSRSEDDILNEVIVRGQSPKYTVWRLEGVEIPNPNHFGEAGHSSGGINMLSANVLAASDFFSGAFPAEYGNALAGVLDMRMRTGNTMRREHTLAVGALGLEATVEGPFSAQKRSSYLVNYRYSTLGLLSSLKLLKLDDLRYEDLSFNIHLPSSRAGTFNVFGVAGISRDRSEDPCNCPDTAGPAYDYEQPLREARTVVGIKHQLVVSPSLFVRSTVVGFHKHEAERIYARRILPTDSLNLADEEFTIEQGIRGQSTLHLKLSSRYVIQVGMGGSLLRYQYRFREQDPFPVGAWLSTLQAEDNTSILRGFAQLSYRPNARLEAHLGIHASQFALNKERTLEPRFGISWQWTARRRLALGIGLHSQHETFGVYQIQRISPAGTPFFPHSRLRAAKSWHHVLVYQERISQDLGLTAEFYYNRGIDIPVSADPESPFSVVIPEWIYPILVHPHPLVNEGSTRNYGVDLSVEKNFSAGTYMLLTGSWFDASYTTRAGTRYPSRYATKYMLKASGGLEKPLGKRQNHAISINGRLLYGGGNRYTPIDETGAPGFPYGALLKPYFRADLSVRFTFNKPHLTNQIFLDIQNVLNTTNQGFVEYTTGPRIQSITTQQGIIPVVGYRVTF